MSGTEKEIGTQEHADWELGLVAAEIRNTSTIQEAKVILKEYKDKILKRQRNLTIDTYKEEESEYNISIVNKLRRAKIE